MFKISIKSIFAYKTRLILTVMSIVLSVGFVAASFIFSDSIRNTFEGIFDEIFKVDATVRPVTEEDGGRPFDTESVGFDESTLDELSVLPGVESSEPFVNSDILLFDTEGELVISQGPPTFGVSWGENPATNPLSIREGDGVAPTSAGEVALDALTVENLGFAIGDTVKIQATDVPEDFTLVGISTFGDQDSLAGATIAAFSFEEAQRFLNLEGQVTEISFIAEDGVSPEQLRDTLAANINEELEAVTGDQQNAEQIADINEGLSFITIALLAFAAVAIFVGAFIIQNTFRIIVAQRAKELALLRAVGASKGQVTRMVLIEAMVVGAVSSGLGIVAGIGLAKLLEFILETLGFGLPSGDLQVNLQTIIVSLAVGIIVTELSAFVPARRASKVSPVAAIRGQVDVAKKKSLQKRFIAGIVVLAIGAGFMWFGLFMDPPFNRLIAVGGGAAVSFLGVSVLSPLLVQPFIYIFSFPARALGLLAGSLAARNTKRSPRRTAATASALMIGVALVAFVGIFANSVKGTIDDIISDNFRSDLILSSKQPQMDPARAVGISKQFVSDVEEVEGIDFVSPAYSAFPVRYDGSQDSDFLFAIDPETFDRSLDVGVDENRFNGLTEPNTVYVNQDHLSENLERAIGDTVNVVVPNGNTEDLEIVGTFSEPFDSDFLVSLSTYEALLDPDEFTNAFVSYEEGVDEETVRAAVAEVEEAHPASRAQSASELAEEIEGQIDMILSLFWGLLGMAIIIAVLGITNTLSLSISERTREIGMTRAIGMTRLQIVKQVMYESVYLALFGAILGLGMGIFFAWAILKALEDEGFTGFVLPWGQLAVYVGLAVIASLFAALIPSIRAARTNVLEAINYE